MSLYGAKELAFSRFDGGVVLTVEPTEIGDDQAADCANVDSRDFGLSVRRGYAPVRAAAPVASPVRGAYRYYPRTGNARFFLQAGTDIYDDSGGSFASAVSGLTGGVPFDFVGHREQVFAGSLADTLRKFDGTSWTTVAPLTPPVNLVAGLYAPTLESFDNATLHDQFHALGWVRTDPNNTTVTASSDDKREGTAALVMNFTSGSKGASLTKAFSFASAVDLSRSEYLVVWYQANKAGATFQVGIAPNDPATLLNGSVTSGAASLTVDSTTGYEVGDYLRIANTSGGLAEVLRVTGVTSATVLAVARGQEGTTAAAHPDNALVQMAVNFALFQQKVTVASDSWVAIRIPLDQVPPARRNAASAVGVKLLNPGKSGFPLNLTFDQLMAQGPLLADSYTYAATYATTEQINEFDVVMRESNPVSATVLQLGDEPPALGVVLTATGTPDAGVTVLRFWRYRATGPFRRGRLVGTAPTATTTNTAAITTTTAVTCAVASAVGISPGCVLRIGAEELLVRATDGLSLTVTRGYNGTTAATHLISQTVTCLRFVDLVGDGDLALANVEELADGRIAPPLAATYALVNGRLYAGHVYLDTDGSGSPDTYYPQRLYVSRYRFPEEFRQTQEPDNDPTSAGWFDLDSTHRIRRLISFDGMLMVFTDRSIYTLEGTGWDDFVLRERARVGLSAREAVLVHDRLIYFLADDGLRVLSPNQTSDNLFPSWVISEPVDSVLRAIPAASRTNAALGLDEWGRVHLSITRSGQTVNDATLVFDPHAGGLGNQEYTPTRRGWTYYTGCGWSCYVALKRGGGDAGQLVGGSAQTAALSYLQRSSADTDLRTDATTLDGNINDSTTSVTLTATLGIVAGTVLTLGTEQLLVGTVNHSTRALTVTRAHAGTTAASHLSGVAVTFPIPWYWQSKAINAGPGKTLGWTVVSLETDPAANESVTVTPVLDGAASATTYTVSLGSATTGFVAVDQRMAPDVRGRFSALRLSGTHGVALRVRAARVGVWERG